MNKRKIIIVISIVIFVLVVFVGIKYFTKENEIDNITTNYESGDNLIVNEEKLETLTELYTSTKGYEIRYDPNKFQLKYEDGKEKFIYMNSEEEIYLLVEVIEDENLESIKNSIIENAEVSGKCKLSNLNLTGTYAENEKEEIINQKLIFDLNETKLLIIEINKFNENSDMNLVNEEITEMLKTIKYNQ